MKKIVFILIIGIFTSLNTYGAKVKCTNGMFDTRIDDAGLEINDGSGTDSDVIELSDIPGKMLEVGEAQYVFRKKESLEKSYTLKINLNLKKEDSSWGDGGHSRLIVRSQLIRDLDKKIVAQAVNSSESVPSENALRYLKNNRPLVVSPLYLWQTVNALEAKGDSQVNDFIKLNEIHKAMELAQTKKLIAEGEPYRVDVFCQVQ